MNFSSQFQCGTLDRASALTLLFPGMCLRSKIFPQYVNESDRANINREI